MFGHDVFMFYCDFYKVNNLPEFLFDSRDDGISEMRSSHKGKKQLIEDQRPSFMM